MQSDSSDQRLYDFIKTLGFEEFSHKLVKTAFTHSSYTMEHNLPHNSCYERLEFLGDAILKMIVTDYLYNKYTELHEGELTKIRSIVVSDEILHKVGQKINIEPYIILGKGAAKNEGQKLQSVQACVMEALFGALYLSADKTQLNKFILDSLVDFIEDIAENKTIYNAKAILQEYAQKQSKVLPVYTLINESGKSPNKTFTMNVAYNGKVLAIATGKTKKAAEQDAAYRACVELGLIKEKEN